MSERRLLDDDGLRRMRLAAQHLDRPRRRSAVLSAGGLPGGSDRGVGGIIRNLDTYVSAMKTAVLVIAVLLLLIGLVWMGQGLGYIKGSFMTGQMLWFWVGLACVVGSGVLAGVRRGLR